MWFRRGTSARCCVTLNVYDQHRILHQPLNHQAADAGITGRQQALPDVVRPPEIAAVYSERRELYNSCSSRVVPQSRAGNRSSMKRQPFLTKQLNDHAAFVLGPSLFISESGAVASHPMAESKSVIDHLQDLNMRADTIPA